MKLKDFWPCDWMYYTQLTVPECISRISCPPLTFGSDPHNPEHYECVRSANTQLMITFTGTRFGGFRRTEYLVSFFEKEERTVISLQFQRELFGFPPLTSTYTLNIFMEQKVQAHRIG